MPALLRLCQALRKNFFGSVRSVNRVRVSRRGSDRVVAGMIPASPLARTQGENRAGRHGLWEDVAVVCRPHVPARLFRPLGSPQVLPGATCRLRRPRPPVAGNGKFGVVNVRTVPVHRQCRAAGRCRADIRRHGDIDGPGHIAAERWARCRGAGNADGMADPGRLRAGLRGAVPADIRPGRACRPPVPRSAGRTEAHAGHPSPARRTGVRRPPGSPRSRRNGSRGPAAADQSPDWRALPRD